jgi:hypothetical protein
VVGCGVALSAAVTRWAISVAAGEPHLKGAPCVAHAPILACRRVQGAAVMKILVDNSRSWCPKTLLLSEDSSILKVMT